MAPSDQFFDFSFPSYGRFRKGDPQTRQKNLPHPTVGAPSASNSPDALCARAGKFSERERYCSSVYFPSSLFHGVDKQRTHVQQRKAHLIIASLCQIMIFAHFQLFKLSQNVVNILLVTLVATSVTWTMIVSGLLANRKIMTRAFYQSRLEVRHQTTVHQHQLGTATCFSFSTAHSS